MLTPDEFIFATDDEKLEFARWYYRRLKAANDDRVITRAMRRMLGDIPNPDSNPEPEDNIPVPTLAFCTADGARSVFIYRQVLQSEDVRCNEEEFWKNIEESLFVFYLNIVSVGAVQRPSRVVRALTLQIGRNMTYKDMISVAEKIDKDTLTNVMIERTNDGPNEYSEQFYSLPQIMGNKGVLRMTKSCITDGQLEKLEHKEIDLGEAYNITSVGVNTILKKRITKGFTLKMLIPSNRNSFKELTDGLEISQHVRVVTRDEIKNTFTIKCSNGDNMLAIANIDRSEEIVTIRMGIH